MSKHSVLQELKSLYMNPLPEDIGPISCVIRRDQSGVNKFSPKYFLLLQENGCETNMLQAVKIQSINCHMHIKIDSPYVSYISKGQETLIGRLRANNGNNAFFIFDFGVNPKDVKQGTKLPLGQRIRRQLGTILYSNRREGQ